MGMTVQMVCFAKFSVYIHLENQIMLTVEADFEHVHDDTKESERTTFPTSRSSLMRLLECSIVTASIDSNGVFLLRFSNGDSLRIEKQHEFESYQLRIGAEDLFA